MYSTCLCRKPDYGKHTIPSQTMGVSLNLNASTNLNGVYSLLIKKLNGRTTMAVS